MKYTFLAVEAWMDGGAVGNHGRTVFSQDCIVSGQMYSRGAVEMNGQMIGDISGASVVIGQNGIVSGDLNADDTAIYGTVFGEIRARSVDLGGTAVVRGNISHDRVSIQAGADLMGRLIRRLAAE